MASFYRNNKCQTFFLFSLYRKIITTIVIQPYHLDIVTKTDGLIDSDSLAGGFTLSLFGKYENYSQHNIPTKMFLKILLIPVIHKYFSYIYRFTSEFPAINVVGSY